MKKRTFIVTMLIVLIADAAFLSIPVANATLQPHGDYSDAEYQPFYFGGDRVEILIPGSETPALRFGFTGAQCMFIDSDDRAVRDVAALCTYQIDARDDLERIVEWVDCTITYKSDTGFRNDRWQHPAETLRLGTGDCEDMAILGASIAEAAGYRTVLVFEDGHILFAMECEPEPYDFTVEYEGRTYVTADPTSGRIGSYVDPFLVTRTMWTPLNIMETSAATLLMIVVVTFILIEVRRDRNGKEEDRRTDRRTGVRVGDVESDRQHRAARARIEQGVRPGVIRTHQGDGGMNG